MIQKIFVDLIRPTLGLTRKVMGELVKDGAVDSIEIHLTVPQATYDKLVALDADAFSGKEMIYWEIGNMRLVVEKV